MNRRAVITALGWATAWPLSARAQRPSMPVVGYLDPRSPEATPDLQRAFRRGLKEAGFVDGENVAIVQRWAENQLDRLPALAADLVGRRVTVLATTASPATSAAKTATSTIPIVFVAPEDPVNLWFVASLARPGGNLTGINWFVSELMGKRLELLRELVPASARVALMVEPSNARVTEATLKDVEAAARAMGLQIQVVNASTSRDIDAVFASFEHERPDALFLGSSTLFNARRLQLVHWASRMKIPASYTGRQYVEAGGLMSYGTNLLDAYAQMGAYVGRVLKGSKPSELPVVQATKFELVINQQAARIIGLSVPPALLARADEVIE
jgi:putative ABC transport system substrate-binding protein